MIERQKESDARTYVYIGSQINRWIEIKKINKNKNEIEWQKDRSRSDKLNNKKIEN